MKLHYLKGNMLCCRTCSLN